MPDRASKIRVHCRVNGQAVTLADVKRVAKRLYDPARLTVVIGGSPTPMAARPAAHSAPLPEGAPVKASAAAPASAVTPASKPADKSQEAPVTTPKAAKKP